MSFFENTRKPVGLGGKLMVAMMNLGHSPVARWGLRFLRLAPNAKVLDCGCGGGANIKRLLKKCPHGVVKGIDYSPVSVERTRKLNRAAIQEGRCPFCKAVWRIWRLRTPCEHFSSILHMAIGMTVIVALLAAIMTVFIH
ncbi:MAG: class I SAM-dependent methyltransferase [Collinsella aerofaciens]|nr:class I SAM-dependent methyltransferase [Collinsella aerofaciens]